MAFSLKNVYDLLSENEVEGIKLSDMVINFPKEKIVVSSEFRDFVYKHCTIYTESSHLKYWVSDGRLIELIVK